MFSIFQPKKLSPTQKSMLDSIKAEISDPETVKLFKSIIAAEETALSVLQDADQLELFSTDLTAAIEDFVKSEGKDIRGLNNFLIKHKISGPRNSPTLDIQQPEELLQIAKKNSSVNLSGLFVTGMAILSQLQTAAAEQISKQEYTTQDGIPKGGVDLCSGASHCVQGWVKDIGGTVVAQFNRIIQISGATNQGVFWQWNSCLPGEKVGQIIIDTLVQMASMGSNSTVATNLSCSATSVSLVATQAVSLVTPVNDAFCQNFKSNYALKTTQCISNSAVVGYDFAITGIIFASVCYCCLMMFAARACVGNNNNCCAD